MIYLDNAATSFPKPKRVIREVTKCITQYCGNPGRSSHKLSIAAADKIYETRELVADFLNIKKCENVIFTPNATYALNMVIPRREEPIPRSSSSPTPISSCTKAKRATSTGTAAAR